MLRREKARRTRGEGAQACGCLGHSPRREKARCTRGEGAQTSGCLGHSLRREKAHCSREEGAQASGCPNRSRGGKRRAAPGESAPKPLAVWAAQAREDTKRRRNQIRAFVEDRKTGTTLNAGPAPYRAARTLSSVAGESTDTPVRGKPSVAGMRGVLSTHSDICLQHPALPVAGLN